MVGQLLYLYFLIIKLTFPGVNKRGGFLVRLSLDAESLRSVDSQNVTDHDIGLFHGFISCGSVCPTTRWT